MTTERQSESARINGAKSHGPISAEGKEKFATVDPGMVLSAAFRSLADESHSMDLLTRYESRLRRIHKQAHAMLLRLRQERQSEPAPPEPPPAPAPTPDLAPVSDAPE